jgi:3-deoxy-D-manno-octulosonate 8-phosphate phosphatase (KDO 8-P phosphatase)
MFTPEKVIKIFSENGAEIISNKEVFINNFKTTKGIILDWDGVFTDGIKGENEQSNFSEIDAMGLNLLRFALWNRDKEMPQIFIITGMNNPTAIHMAKREGFTAVYQGVKDKSKAIEHIYFNYKIKADELICFFDDVLDIAMAKDCGLKFLVNRKSNPLFIEYVKNKTHCDYITGALSGSNPIREVCEFLIGINGIYEIILDERITFSPIYSSYWNQRKSLEPNKFFWQDDKII